MRRLPILALLTTLPLICLSLPALAQEFVPIPTRSKTYRVSASLETPPDWNGSRGDEAGFPGKVRISRKGNLLQEITLPVLATNGLSPKNPQNSTTSELVASFLSDSFVFEDFNFDGREDLAICTGREGGYDGPSYDVFLFEPKKAQFIRNEGLSELTVNGYLGLFKVNSRTRTLTARSKAGCCIHQADFFKVVKNQPVLVKSIIEQYESDTNLTIVTRRKVGNRWVETVRSQKPPRQKS